MTHRAVISVLISVALGSCGEPDPETRPEGMTEVGWGEQLFYQKGCAACHDLHGQRRDGPPTREAWGALVELEGGGTARFDEAYVRRAILNPTEEVVRGYPPNMPSYRGGLTESQVTAIVAFLRERCEGPQSRSQR